MKKLFLGILLVSATTVVNSQAFRVNGVDTFLAVDNNDSKYGSNLSAEDIRKIKLKKYLTEGFKPAIFNDEKSTFFLRYNIYEDQMEFTKEEKVYYLQKLVNNKVKFRNMNKTYTCKELNGSLQYVHEMVNSSKLGLVAKETVQFVEAKKAQTNYDRDKPASFQRKKDQYFFVQNGELIPVPKRKKDFTSFFTSNESTIKKFMKKEKINFKKAADLKKIVAFVNALN